MSRHLYLLVVVLCCCRCRCSQQAELDNAKQQLLQRDKEIHFLRDEIDDLASQLESAVLLIEELQTNLSQAQSAAGGNVVPFTVVCGSHRRRERQQMSERHKNWAEGADSSNSAWEVIPSEWQSWIFQLYAEAVASATKLNAAADAMKFQREDSGQENGLDLKFIERVQEVNRPFDTNRRTDALVAEIPIPVFILNMESRPDRKDHMLALLKSVGFSNVSVHNALTSQELDWSTLVSQGKVDARSEAVQSIAGIYRRRGEEAAMRFVANALNHFDLHSRAMRDNLPLYAIMEDDLLPASSHAEVNSRIVKALDAWPADGDTLHLELCFERCEESLYSAAHRSVLRTADPHCTAAVIYRQKAARRILNAIRPAYMSIDAMLAAMVGAGSLTAYAAAPLAFFQDSVFGSDVAMRRDNPRHGVAGVVCAESEEFLVQDLEMRFVAVVRSEQGVEYWALPVGGLHSRVWGQLEEGEVVAYYTLSSRGSEGKVEVMTCRGRAPGKAEECSWQLEVRSHSACFGAKHVCQLEMVRHASGGSEMESNHQAVLVQRAPLGRRVE